MAPVNPTRKDPPMKATHQGQCQVCGRLQMLPKFGTNSDGLLSKHGYEIAGWGFFNGVCTGAGALPFEQDISLIQSAIGYALSQAKLLRASAAVHRANKQADIVECQVYEVIDSRGRHGHRERFGRLEMQSEYAPVFIYEVNGEQRKERLNPGTLENTLQRLNESAASRDDHAAEQAEKYARWQQARIKGWKPHPEKLVALNPERRSGPAMHLAHPKHKGQVLCTLSRHRSAGMGRTEEQSKVTCAKCLKGIKEGWWGIKVKAA
jgi:hypothetical protein